MARRPRVPPTSHSLLEVRGESPDRRKLSFRQIEVFRAVMRSGSVNAASQVLSVSQPSLSRVIKRMGDVLGFELFERVKGRLVPTKEARIWRGSASALRSPGFEHEVDPHRQIVR